MENKIWLGIEASIEGISQKVECLFSELWGWILLMGVTVLNFFAPVQTLFYVLVALIVVDAVFGLTVAIKNEEGFISDKMRSSFYKLAVYLVALCLVYLVEYTLEISLTLKVLFAVAYAIELISIFANMLILKPDMPFLRLVSGALVGEIASKLGMSKDDVKDVLDKEKIKKKKDENSSDKEV